MVKKYEEYAYVLSVEPRGKSIRVKGREGIIVQAIGEERLTLLELLGTPGISIDVGERVYIGREGRTKILSVLGKLEYNELNPDAKDELLNHILPKLESCIRQKLLQSTWYINTKLQAPEACEEFVSNLVKYIKEFLEKGESTNIYKFLAEKLKGKLVGYARGPSTSHGHGSKPKKRVKPKKDWLLNKLDEDKDV